MTVAWGEGGSGWSWGGGVEEAGYTVRFVGCDLEGRSLNCTERRLIRAGMFGSRCIVRRCIGVEV